MRHPNTSLLRNRSFNSPLIRRMLFVAGASFALREALRWKRRIDLQSRLVLIAGGSRGLGLALAYELARRKMRIVLSARSGEELAVAAASLRRRGAEVFTFGCDFQDADRVANLIRTVHNTCGNIDVLVNCAGTICVGPLEATSLQDFHDAMDGNFWGAANTTLAVLPAMRERGEGRIVNIASIGGKIPVPHLASYCASKFALVGFSSALRTELIKDGIYVTTVNPGLMRTGSPRNAKFKGNHQAEYGWFSVSDSLPGISMSAAKAARCIAKALVNGDAEVTLGVPANIAATMHGLMPSLHSELISIINRFLPAGSDHEQQYGRDSESPITQSFLTNLTRRAEQQYNQLHTTEE